MIKCILDFPTQHLANVTFKTSLAFQMREGYMFDFFKIFIWISRGVSIGVTNCHANVMHVLRYSAAYKLKTTTKKLEKNTGSIFWS